MGSSVIMHSFYGGLAIFAYVLSLKSLHLCRFALEPFISPSPPQTSIENSLPTLHPCIPLEWNKPASECKSSAVRISESYNIIVNFPNNFPVIYIKECCIDRNRRRLPLRPMTNSKISRLILKNIKRIEITRLIDPKICRVGPSNRRKRGSFRPRKLRPRSAVCRGRRKRSSTRLL